MSAGLYSQTETMKGLKVSALEHRFNEEDLTARIEDMSPEKVDNRPLKISENATEVPVQPKSPILIRQNSV